MDGDDLAQVLLELCSYFRGNREFWVRVLDDVEERPRGLGSVGLRPHPRPPQIFAHEQATGHDAREHVVPVPDPLHRPEALKHE